MANEYINRSRLLRHLSDWWLTESPTGNEILFINGEPQTTPVMKVIEECMKSVEEQPTADVVEVVRCKDCEYWQDNNNGYPHEECRWGKDETPDTDDYCSYGKKVE